MEVGEQVEIQISDNMWAKGTILTIKDDMITVSLANAMLLTRDSESVRQIKACG